jgi:type II secretion system protein N
MKVPRIELGRLGDLSRLRALPLHLSGRQRTIARWAGISLLALVSFLFTLKFTFPYDRLEGKLAEVLAGKYDVTVGDVGGGFLPGTVVFENVVLRSRPDQPGEKATEIAIDELVLDMGLDFGLLGALRKKVVFDVDAELVGGTIEAEVESSTTNFEAHIETEALELGKLPGVAAAVGLPLSGALDAKIDLQLPGAKWKNAEGNIALDCVGCTVGDGVAKLTMTPNGSSRRRRSAGAAAFQSTGVTVPRLALGQAQVQVDISKGVGEIKNFSATSQDGWLKIEGKIEFRDPFANTLFPGCMRFKLSDELKRRDPKFGNIEYTLSEKTRQQDGSFAIPTKGRLAELRWDVRRKCGTGGASDSESDDRGVSERPGLARRPRLGRPGAGGADGDERPGATEGVRREVSATPEPGGEGRGGRDGTEGVPQPGSSGPSMSGRGSPGDAGAAPSAQPPDGHGGGDQVLQRMPPEQEQQPAEGQPPPPPPGGEAPPPPPPDHDGEGGQGGEMQPPPEAEQPPADQPLPDQPPDQLPDQPPEQAPDQPPDQPPPQEQPQEGQYEPPPRDPEDRTVQ